MLKSSKSNTGRLLLAGQRVRSTAAMLVMAGVAGVGIYVVFQSHAATSNLVPAQTATSFLNSMGVNVHMSYPRYANGGEVLADLQFLGMRHVRNNLGVGEVERVRLDQLRNAGIRFNFVALRPPSGTNGLKNVVDVVKQRYLAATDSVEGSNEYDEKAPDWVAALRAYQAQLYTMMKADSALHNVVVLGPSLKGFSMGSTAPSLGNLSSVMDAAAVHTYPGGLTPETSASNTRNDPESRIALEKQYVSGTKPVYVTESGYNNALDNCTTMHLPATERTAGVYMPRLYLEHFRLGVVRTYGYELLDQGTSCDGEQRFGLYRLDGSPKPAAQALHNLTTLLSDARDFTPHSLNYAVTSGTAGLHQVLLEKSDGSFWLALWRSNSIAQAAIPPVDTSVVDQSLSLSFGQPIASARVYRPNVGVSPTSTTAAISSLTLPVGSDVTLVSVVPGTAATPTPTPTPPPTSTPPPSRTPTPTPTPSSTPGGTPTPSPNPADTQRPVLSGQLAATLVTDTQIALQWAPATDNVGVRGYRLYRNELQIADQSGTTYLDQSLSASTSYRYEAEAYDAAGNVSARITLTAATQAPPIVAPPGNGDLSIIPSGTDIPVSIAPGAQPMVGGIIMLASPGTSSAHTIVRVDGVISSTNGSLDTSYLTNGNHMVSTEIKLANGKTVKANRVIDVENTLSGWQTLRNQLFAPFRGNKSFIAAALVVSLALFLAIGGLTWRHLWKLRNGS